MSRPWARLGLRGRLAIAIAAIVVAAFGVVYVVVRAQVDHESDVIRHEEAREASGATEGPRLSPIEDAQSDVEATLVVAGALALVAALLGGYLLAARAASPLRRFAATAAEVDAGDLTPRLEEDPRMPAELQTLAEAFNHMLDRLDREFARQRQFVSDASHELRSPLTAIRGQIEVLARDPNPSSEEVRRTERAAMEEIRRVERLLDDLMALARLDEGVRGKRRRLDPAALLSELCSASGSGVELGELAAGSIAADPDLLTQVIRNLLSNARRHAGAAGRVRVSSLAREGSLVVSVDDDGPGIPPEERERVFDRFHRSDAARDRASGGSGLGLGIARSIVEAHGGRIWVEDSPLGGARVSFELPTWRPPIRDLSPDA